MPPQVWANQLVAIGIAKFVWSPLLLQYWQRLHKFWRQKTWCDLPAHLCQYFLSTSYHPQALPDGQSLLNPTLWRTFKLGKPSLPSLMSMTMTIMTWESQFTAAFKRIESSRSGPAHHYWSNTALSDHHNDMVVMKIKLWTPNTSTTTRFSTFCKIYRLNYYHTYILTHFIYDQILKGPFQRVEK